MRTQNGRLSGKKAQQNFKTSVHGNTNTGTFLMAQESDRKLWGTSYIDSRASFYINNNIGWFNIDSIKTTDPISIRLGDKTTALSKQKGNISNYISLNIKMQTFPVRDVLFVQGMATIILSVGQIDDRGHKVQFQRGLCRISSLNGSGNLLEVRKENQHIVLKVLWQKKRIIRDIQLLRTVSNYGMLVLDMLKNLLYLIQSLEKQLYVFQKILEQKGISICRGFGLGKMVSRSFPAIGKFQSQKKLDLVHADVCAPISVRSKGRKQYSMSFTEEYTRKTFIYFLQT